MKKIVGIVGSLREGSYNRGLMNAFVAQAPEGAVITVAEIGDLPLYNQDLEQSAFPEAAQALKKQIEEADAIIIATPEYNRSVPGALKNAIDWASRPYGENSFDGKPVLVVGASVGPIAAALAQYHLKQIMLYLNARVIGQPEFYLGHAGDKFDAAGNLTDVDTKGYVDRALQALIGVI